jgi:hypothetical protein
MDQLANPGRIAGRRSALRGLALIGAGVAAAFAAVIAAVFAVFAAATIAVLSLIGAMLVAVAALAFRARRAGRPAPADDGVMEARHLGGHSWVAYGWDQGGR